MQTVRDVYEIIDKVAPFSKAMSFDNVGLLVGGMSDKVKGILVSLDVTKEVINEAISKKSNLIVSHHPVIFNPIKAVYSNSVVYLLAKNNINVICAHTNLDIAENGVNYWLAKRIGVLNHIFMSECGIIGDLEFEFNTVRDFAIHIKEALKSNGVRYTDIPKSIRKVSVCSGSGGCYVREAYDLGADAIVTGEIKHNQILDANEMGLAVIDAGHFQTEDVVIGPLKEYLESSFEGLSVFRSKTCNDKICYV